MYYEINYYLIRLYMYMLDHVANQFSVLLCLNICFSLLLDAKYTI